MKSNTELQYRLLLRLDSMYHISCECGEPKGEENPYYNDPIYYGLLFDDNTHIDCTLFKGKEILMFNSFDTYHGKAKEWYNSVYLDTQSRTKRFVEENAIEILDYRLEDKDKIGSVLEAYR